MLILFFVCDFFGTDTPMMLLAVLMYLAVSTATDVAAECPDCIRGAGVCYSLSYLYDLPGNFRTKTVIPKLDIRHSDNTLFYSYEPVFADPEYYKVAYVNLDNPENNGTVQHPNITLPNFRTFAIQQDNSNPVVYLGGKEGIFTYNDSGISWYSSRGDDILNLFFKDNLYILKTDIPRIIKKEKDQFTNVLDVMPIKNFVVTNDNVIVYLERYGLFLKKGQETVMLSKNPFFRGITVDLDGVVYTWWIDEVYKIDIKKDLLESRLVKAFHIKSLVAMTFDNINNILFAVNSDAMSVSLNKLSRMNSTDC